MKKIFFFLFSFYFIANNVLGQYQAQCGTTENPQSSGSSGVTLANQICTNGNICAFIENHEDDLVPQTGANIKLAVNVILCQKSDGTGNFSMSNPRDVEYFNKIFENINQRLANNFDESCNCRKGGEPPICITSSTIPRSAKFCLWLIFLKNISLQCNCLTMSLLKKLELRFLIHKT